MSGADLSSIKNKQLLYAQNSIVPEVGKFIGWKKAYDANKNEIIIKLEIGETAQRSNATGRKCRAEWVTTLEIFGAEIAYSSWDNSEYKVGEIKKSSYWEENRWIECGGGIHFFLSRIEAENYLL